MNNQLDMRLIDFSKNIMSNYKIIAKSGMFLAPSKLGASKLEASKLGASKLGVTAFMATVSIVIDTVTII
jgi:hypothetical protein